MYMASIFADVGGVKTLVLVLLAAVISWYLWVLSRREKKEENEVLLTAESLAALPDDQLMDAVIKSLLADCEAAGTDPYRRTAVWANPQVNVYSVWVIVKELEQTTFSQVARTPSGAFLPLAIDGLEQLGAPAAAAAVEAADEAAFAQAVATEQPLLRAVEYIRDHADAFVK